MHIRANELKLTIAHKCLKHIGKFWSRIMCTCWRLRGKFCPAYSIVADYVHKIHLGNTDQELCVCVEGLEENLVLQIQWVPPAVWTPLYQSAFYVLTTFAIIIVIITSISVIITTIVIIDITFPSSISTVNVFYMRIDKEQVLMNLSYTLLVKRICLIFNLAFCVCFFGSQRSFCTKCDCLSFLF